MNVSVRIGMIVAGMLLLVSVLRALARQRMNEQLSLLWLLPAAALMLFGLFPSIYDRLAAWCGVIYTPVLALASAIILLFFLLFRSMGWISSLTKQLHALSIRNALMQDELDSLRERLDREAREDARAEKQTQRNESEKGDIRERT